MNKDVVEPWEGRTELTINLVIYRQIFIIKNVYTSFSGEKNFFGEMNIIIIVAKVM